MSLTTRQLTLIAAVREHALANYDTDGWDYIVECYEDDELAELIGRARTEASAIKKVAEEVKLKDEYRAEIQGIGDTYDYSKDVFEDEIQAPVEEVHVRTLIAVEDATSVEDLEQEYFGQPQDTITGVVCGQCSKHERETTGDRKAQVHHASAAHVRLCYSQRAAMDAESAAEQAAERSVERHFENLGFEAAREQEYYEQSLFA